MAKTAKDGSCPAGAHSADAPERPTAIPQVNPHANYLVHKADIDATIQRVLDRGHYILGPEVEAFEKEFAEYLDVKSAIGVGNGTDALQVALRACGVDAGDAVITVSHTSSATVTAIMLIGAHPVLIDIDPDTYTIDPGCLKEAVECFAESGMARAGSRLKAVLPVHLYGHPADMAAILDIAHRHDLRVIEDCAQSHGAKCSGIAAGACGDISAFSFYPTKNLGALGDGGAVATNDAALAQAAKLIRQYGWRERQVSSILGMNSRLDELQAAILRVKLRSLDRDNLRRREIAAIYQTSLQGLGLNLPAERRQVTHVYHQFVIRHPRRDELAAWLRSHGVGTQIHYPFPVHRQPAYAALAIAGERGMHFTEAITPEILSLPMYPELTDADVHRVAGLVRQWVTVRSSPK